MHSTAYFFTNSSPPLPLRQPHARRDAEPTPVKVAHLRGDAIWVTRPRADKLRRRDERKEQHTTHWHTFAGEDPQRMWLPWLSLNLKLMPWLLLAQHLMRQVHVCEYCQTLSLRVEVAVLRWIGDVDFGRALLGWGHIFLVAVLGVALLIEHN